MLKMKIDLWGMHARHLLCDSLLPGYVHSVKVSLSIFSLLYFIRLSLFHLDSVQGVSPLIS